jgi:hypothetical protein
MATYKVIQDIEAEDHIIGPLTLRQFIFALISIFFFYICFVLIAKGLVFFLVIFLPPALSFGFFAIPFGRDQPTEIWALAKIRFWLKPRKRIWDQSRVKELVTITVPKKIDQVLTNGLNPYEVQSRLKVLASTLDSRGWAIKNQSAATDTYTVTHSDTTSERLIDLGAIPEAVSEENTPPEADILDDYASPVAQQFTQMINQSSQEHRQQLINLMNTPSSQGASPSVSSNQWFMPSATNDTSSQTTQAQAAQIMAVSPDDIALETKLKDRRKAKQAYASNLRTIQPTTVNTGGAKPLEELTQKASPPLTQQPDPAILNLVNRNDLNLDTIARELKRAKGEEFEQGEVVVKLH